MVNNSWALPTAGAATAALSFAVTLWVTTPRQSEPWTASLRHPAQGLTALQQPAQWLASLPQPGQWLTSLRQIGQWVTTAKPQARPEDLSKQFIFDVPSLSEVAGELGLDRTEELSGSVDAIAREASGVRIVGWTFDAARNPVTVYLFRRGQMMLKMIPKGKRADVAQAYPWASRAAGDVQFEGLFQCQPGDVMIAVLLSPDGRYNWLKTPVCP